MTEDSLSHGTVHIRDRETCWFEEIHCAHVARRLVHIYQKRDVPNTWEEIKDKFSADQVEAKAAKKKKKAKEKKSQESSRQTK